MRDWLDCLLKPVRAHLERARRVHAPPETAAGRAAEARDAALRARLRNIDAAVALAYQQRAEAPQPEAPAAPAEAAQETTDAMIAMRMTLHEAAQARAARQNQPPHRPPPAPVEEWVRVEAPPPVEEGVPVVEGGPVLEPLPLDAVRVPRDAPLRVNRWGAPALRIGEPVDPAEGLQFMKILDEAWLHCDKYLKVVVTRLVMWHDRNRWAQLTSVDQTWEKIKVQERLDRARKAMLAFWHAIETAADWAAATESRLAVSVEVSLLFTLVGALAAVEGANKDLFDAIQDAPSGATPTTSQDQADEWVMQTVKTKQAIATLGQFALEAATRPVPPCDPRIYRMYQQNADKLCRMAEPVPEQAVEWAREAELRVREREYRVRAEERRTKLAAQQRRDEEAAARNAIAEQEDAQAFQANQAVRQAAWERQAVEGHGVDCTVCWTETAQWAVVPCGHLCLCENCSRDPRVPHCPICRRKKEGTMRVFLN